LQHLGGSGKPREVSDQIAEDLNLPSTVVDATLQDGTPRFHNQVAWSRDYLVRQGLLDAASRGTWVLTERGWAEKPIIENAREIIIRAFQGEAEETGAEPEYPLLDTPATPTSESLPSELGSEGPQSFVQVLLQVLKGLSPKGFERLCARLLRVSGFDNVVVTGQSHDGGFDGNGRLRVNPFVSMIVNFQCKRYAGTVSRQEVGDFRNSLLGRAEKGIFLTTGTFSAEAKKEAERVDPKIELVDGERLVEMFQDLKLGVKERKEFDVDYPFFEQYKV
jgi:restriction system protein